jgi:hypothetical protein
LRKLTESGRSKSGVGMPHFGRPNRRRSQQQTDGERIGFVRQFSCCDRESANPLQTHIGFVWQNSPEHGDAANSLHTHIGFVRSFSLRPCHVNCLLRTANCLLFSIGFVRRIFALLLPSKLSTAYCVLPIIVNWLRSAHFRFAPRNSPHGTAVISGYANGFWRPGFL